MFFTSDDSPSCASSLWLSVASASVAVDASVTGGLNVLSVVVVKMSSFKGEIKDSFSDVVGINTGKFFFAFLFTMTSPLPFNDDTDDDDVTLSPILPLCGTMVLVNFLGTVRIFPEGNSGDTPASLVRLFGPEIQDRDSLGLVCMLSFVLLESADFIPFLSPFGGECLPL